MSWVLVLKARGLSVLKTLLCQSWLSSKWTWRWQTCVCITLVILISEYSRIIEVSRLLYCQVVVLLCLSSRGKQCQQIVNCLLNIFLSFLQELPYSTVSVHLWWIATFYPCLAGKLQQPSDFASLYVFLSSSPELCEGFYHLWPGILLLHLAADNQVPALLLEISLVYLPVPSSLISDCVSNALDVQAKNYLNAFINSLNLHSGVYRVPTKLSHYFSEWNTSGLRMFACLLRLVCALPNFGWRSSSGFVWKLCTRSCWWVLSPMSWNCN